MDQYEQLLIATYQHTVFFWGSVYLNMWAYFGIAPPEWYVVLSWAITLSLILVVLNNKFKFTRPIGRLIRFILSPRAWFRPWRLQRGKAMNASERDTYVRSLVADGITNFLEDLEYNGNLTRDEVNEWYDHLATACKLPDLMRTRIERDNDVVETPHEAEKIIEATTPAPKTNGKGGHKSKNNPKPPAVPASSIPTPPVRDVTSAASALSRLPRPPRSKAL